MPPPYSFNLEIMCCTKVTRFHFHCGHTSRYTIPSPYTDCPKTKEVKYFVYNTKCLGCLQFSRGTIEESITCNGRTTLKTVNYTMKWCTDLVLEQFNAETLRERRLDFLKEVNALETMQWKEEIQSVLLNERIKDIHPRARTFWAGSEEKNPGLTDTFFRPVPADFTTEGTQGIPTSHRRCSTYKPPLGGIWEDNDEPRQLPCECGNIFSLGYLETHFASGSDASCPGCGFEFKILRDSDIVTSEKDMMSKVWV